MNYSEARDIIQKHCNNSNVLIFPLITIIEDYDREPLQDLGYSDLCEVMFFPVLRDAEIVCGGHNEVETKQLHVVARQSLTDALGENNVPAHVTDLLDGSDDMQILLLRLREDSEESEASFPGLLIFRSDVRLSRVILEYVMVHPTKTWRNPQFVDGGYRQVDYISGIGVGKYLHCDKFT